CAISVKVGRGGCRSRRAIFRAIATEVAIGGIGTIAVELPLHAHIGAGLTAKIAAGAHAGMRAHIPHRAAHRSAHRTIGARPATAAPLRKSRAAESQYQNTSKDQCVFIHRKSPWLPP